MNRVIKVDSSAISFDEKTNEVIIIKLPLFLLLGVDFKAFHDTTNIELLNVCEGDERTLLAYNNGVSYDGDNLRLNASRDDIMYLLKTNDLSTISFSLIINNMNELIKILISKDIELDNSLNNIVTTTTMLKKDYDTLDNIYYKLTSMTNNVEVDINDEIIIDFIMYNKDDNEAYPISRMRKKISVGVEYNQPLNSIVVSDDGLINYINNINNTSVLYYGSADVFGYFAEHDKTDRITLMKLEYRCYVDDSTFIVHGVKEENPNDDNFIDRIHIELKELEEKFNKLSAFLETDVYKKMDSEEHKFLLYNQHIAMNLYVKTLKARLFLLEKKI